MLARIAHKAIYEVVNKADEIYNQSKAPRLRIVLDRDRNHDGVFAGEGKRICRPTTVRLNVFSTCYYFSFERRLAQTAGIQMPTQLTCRAGFAPKYSLAGSCGCRILFTEMTSAGRNEVNEGANKVGKDRKCRGGGDPIETLPACRPSSPRAD